MKITFLVLGVVVLLFSCKKEDHPKSNYVVPNTTGSYWIYDWYRIDSLGNESFYARDTVEITGQISLNGNEYTVYEGTILGTYMPPVYERDSSGYIVNQNGDIKYSYVNFTDTLKTEVDLFKTNMKMAGYTNFNSGLGNFAALDQQIFVTKPDGSPVNACGDYSYTNHSYFVSNIGLVQQNTFFMGEFLLECKTLRKDLVEYYIAP